jgi:hypothetical protein
MNGGFSSIVCGPLLLNKKNSFLGPTIPKWAKILAGHTLFILLLHPF